MERLRDVRGCYETLLFLSFVKPLKEVISAKMRCFYLWEGFYKAQTVCKTRFGSQGAILDGFKAKEI